MQIDIYVTVGELASYALYQKAFKWKHSLIALASIICQPQNVCPSSQPPETDCHQHFMFFLSLGRMLLMNSSKHAEHIFHLEWWRRNKKERRWWWRSFSSLSGLCTPESRFVTPYLEINRWKGANGQSKSVPAVEGWRRGLPVLSVSTNITLRRWPCNTIPEYHILIRAVGLTH